MSKVCELTGKKPAVAMNVSHAHNRTKTRQLPNLQVKKFMSDILGRNVTLKLSTNAIRTIAKYGGIDEFFLKAKNKRTENFSTKAAKLRKQVKAKAAN